MKATCAYAVHRPRGMIPDSVVPGPWLLLFVVRTFSNRQSWIFFDKVNIEIDQTLTKQSELETFAILVE